MEALTSCASDHQMVGGTEGHFREVEGNKQQVGQLREWGQVLGEWGGSKFLRDETGGTQRPGI